MTCRFSDDDIIDMESVHSLHLPTRAHNVVVADYIGVSVGEMRTDLTRRLARVRNCGVATRDIILAAFDGKCVPVTRAAVTREIARIRKDAIARIEQFRAEHLVEA